MQNKHTQAVVPYKQKNRPTNRKETNEFHFVCYNDVNVKLAFKSVSWNNFCVFEDNIGIYIFKIRKHYLSI